MKIQIYQIDIGRDENRVALMGYDDAVAQQNSTEIDSSIYDLIYEGEMKQCSLEAVYDRFRTNPPAKYYGRRMSVSDVVHISDSSATEEGFYFCDNHGFRQVTFLSTR